MKKNPRRRQLPRNSRGEPLQETWKANITKRKKEKKETPLKKQNKRGGVPYTSHRPLSAHPMISLLPWSQNQLLNAPLLSLFLFFFPGLQKQFPDFFFPPQTRKNTHLFCLPHHCLSLCPDLLAGREFMGRLVATSPSS